METIGRNWTTKTINSALLKSTQPYQREIKANKVRYAVAHFDPNKVDIVHVSLRNGMYYIIDGQHTVRILEEHNGGKPLGVLCAVHEGLTYEDEARFYAEQYSKKSVQTTAEIAVAKYEANDPDYRELADTLSALGARMTYDNKHKSGIRIDSIKNVLREYKKNNQAVIDAIKCLTSAYDGRESKLYGIMIIGLAEFMRVYGDKVSQERMVKSLAKTDQKGIINTVKNLKMGYPMNWCECIRNIYNQGYRKKLEYIIDTQ